MARLGRANEQSRNWERVGKKGEPQRPSIFSNPFPSFLRCACLLYVAILLRVRAIMHRHAPQWGGVLRDDPNNGCEATL